MGYGIFKFHWNYVCYRRACFVTLSIDSTSPLISWWQATSQINSVVLELIHCFATTIYAPIENLEAWPQIHVMWNKNPNQNFWIWTEIQIVPKSIYVLFFSIIDLNQSMRQLFQLNVLQFKNQINLCPNDFWARFKKS